MCQVAFYVFIFLLLLSVAASEIPELSKLVDDTSNDAIEMVASAECLPAPDLHRLDAANSGGAFETEDKNSRNGWIHSFPFLRLAITEHDRLCFLAIRRT